MLISMTGFGSATTSNDSMSVTAEMRSVNNRFYEFSARLPKHLQSRELDLKEIVRARIKRGKVNLSVSIERGQQADQPARINADAAKAYVALLTELRDSTGIAGDITLDMLLKFPDVLGGEEQVDIADEEWALVTQAVQTAAEQLLSMRSKEGAELSTDLAARVSSMDASIARIEELSAGRVDIERARLQERIAAVLSDDRVDPERIEMEIVMLADKMDITEELVRFRSHVKFFLEALEAEESEGRKLSFLLQEMNREANTIGSKSYDADIAHLVVSIKEELERIREQIQNIE
ncbi:MAG TPA: YicC family protein [Bacteroidota bacterium]|nr:YicC family protein [Bacteroidota bacterium]